MPQVPAVPGARTLVERVEGVLDPDTGPLPALFEGFEPRLGQQRLAGAVAQTFQDGGTLLAEAGTGIGKTLAYLIPAVLAGRRVLISTGTRNLQDQIFYKDVPAVARALGRPVRAAYMKGRTNYLCLHRFGRLQEVAAALVDSERHWLERIAEWAPETATGDRAEIDDLPDDLPLWSELTSNSEQCLGRDCPQYSDCFITRMREQAADAELVIVNHHLLCADASVREGKFGEVIPPCDLLVIDEAHQIEDVVTQYFGVALGTHRIEEFVRDATAVAGALTTSDVSRAAKVSEAAIEVQRSGRYLFDTVRLEVRGRAGTGDRATLTPQMAERLQPDRDHLQDALSGLIAALSPEGPRQDDLDGLRVRAEALSSDLKTLTQADDPRYVHFVELRGRGASLRAAPIDASNIIRDSVVGSRHATVLTSATLTIEGGFDYARGRMGMAHADTLRLASEFDYRTQAILYLPAEMPDPRSSEFNGAAADVVAELLECTRGRAFVLFTSYAALREVHALLERRVSWPLFVQGTAPRPALLRDFRATPHAVLLATSSFWQGVDVSGEALSCVIIDRLPFASPADPLVAARIGAIQAQGGHPFRDYQVPLATLTLLQGLGRLIRTRTDRGVLTVLDPRLTRMGYGRRFLGSMPAAPITTDLEEVRRFFAGRRGSIERS